MKTLQQSLRILVALTVLTGFAYPLLVTVIAQIAFHDTATGSHVKNGGQVVGSALLAQKTESPRYFWPRPSASDYATVPSAASNLGPTSAALKEAVAERRAKFGEDVPEDLLTISASGLDPHLSPAAAKHQAARVASARQIPLESVHALIDRLTEPPQLDILGESRVNILSLNLALDGEK